MEVGDAVRIRAEDGVHSMWPESEGQIGIVIELKYRLFVPAAMVMVLGEICEWDESELEVVNESR